MKQTGLQVRPMFHWIPDASKPTSSSVYWLCRSSVLRKLRRQLPWERIADTLAQLKAVRYRSESRTIVQRTKIPPELAETPKSSIYQRAQTDYQPRRGHLSCHRGIDTRSEIWLLHNLDKPAKTAVATQPPRTQVRVDGQIDFATKYEDMEPVIPSTSFPLDRSEASGRTLIEMPGSTVPEILRQRPRHVTADHH